MKIEDWPKLAAGLVALVSLGSFIWTSASAFSAIGSTLTHLQSEVVLMKDYSQKNNAILMERTQIFDSIETSIAAINKEMLRVVYVNHSHMVVETPDGQSIKLPFLERSDEGMTSLKEYLVSKGICDDIRTCG